MLPLGRDRIQQILFRYIPEWQVAARVAASSELANGYRNAPDSLMPYKRNFASGTESAEVGLLRAAWIRVKQWWSDGPAPGPAII
jgi:hypothetical protein